MARHLLHAFSTFGVGGPEVRVCDLINHFGARYRHTIIAMDNNFDCKIKLQSDAPVQFLTIDNHKTNLLKNLRQFASILRTQKPDVLLTYNWGAIEWGLVNTLLRQCVHLHAEDGFGPDEAITQKKKRVIARRLFLQGAQRIVVPSRGLERVALEVWKFPSSRVTYIANGIHIDQDTHITNPDAIIRLIPALKKAENEVWIGTVAKLRKEKNIPRLLRAFKLTTMLIGTQVSAKLFIVGSGPEEALISTFIRENQLENQVYLLGYQNNPGELAKAFDIFAISSDTEQMPISVLEAMAASRPIVGTDVGDIKDMIAPSNQQFMCPASDESAFAEHLKTLLLNPALRTEIGQDNYRKCQQMYDKSLMFQNYAKLYDLAR